MKKRIVVLIIITALLVVFWGVISSERQVSMDNTRDFSTFSTGVETGPYAAVNESSCGEAGGTWNNCGSACRTQPDAACIDLCVVYCECDSNDQCPAGFTCGDYVDGLGVCL